MDSPSVPCAFSWRRRTSLSIPMPLSPPPSSHLIIPKFHPFHSFEQPPSRHCPTFRKAVNLTGHWPHLECGNTYFYVFHILHVSSYNTDTTKEHGTLKTESPGDGQRGRPHRGAGARSVRRDEGRRTRGAGGGKAEARPKPSGEVETGGTSPLVSG